MAISVSGSYLKGNSETELLSELILIFEDGDEDSILRQDAYLAMGRDWDELPSAAWEFDIRKQTDPSVVEEAKRHLAEDASKT